jgi:uncharacterized protein
MFTKLTITSILIFSFLSLSAQTKKESYWDAIPNYVGWINDFENIFSEKEEQFLDSLISAYEDETGVEIAVITIPEFATERDRFYEFVSEIGEKWGVGKRALDNGILIAISKEHKALYITYGTGFIGTLTDEGMSTINNTKLIPNFKKGDFFKGTLEGIQEIIRILNQGIQEDKAKVKE